MGEIQHDLKRLQRNLKNKRAMLDALGEKVFLPYFGQRMTDMGIKDKTRTLRHAVTTTCSRGSIFEVTDDSLTVGVDYEQVPHAEWIFEGAKPHAIVARRAKFLRFYWEKLGVYFVGKRVKHPGIRTLKPIYSRVPGLVDRVMPVIVAELDKP